MPSVENVCVFLFAVFIVLSANPDCSCLKLGWFGSIGSGYSEAVIYLPLQIEPWYAIQTWIIHTFFSVSNNMPKPDVSLPIWNPPPRYNLPRRQARQLRNIWGKHDAVALLNSGKRRYLFWEFEIFQFIICPVTFQIFELFMGHLLPAFKSWIMLDFDAENQGCQTMDCETTRMP